jgi:hypothetical protein
MGWHIRFDYNIQGAKTVLMDTKEQYLALAVEKLKLMREEIPFIEVGLRVNEILDYLWYLEN